MKKREAHGTPQTLRQSDPYTAAHPVSHRAIAILGAVHTERIFVFINGMLGSGIIKKCLKKHFLKVKLLMESHI